MEKKSIVYISQNPPSIYVNRENTRRKQERKTIFEKFWEVQKPIYKKVFDRAVLEEKLDGGFG